MGKALQPQTITRCFWKIRKCFLVFVPSFLKGNIFIFLKGQSTLLLFCMLFNNLLLLQNQSTFVVKNLKTKLFLVLRDHQCWTVFLSLVLFLSICISIYLSTYIQYLYFLNKNEIWYLVVATCFFKSIIFIFPLCKCSFHIISSPIISSPQPKFPQLTQNVPLQLVCSKPESNPGWWNASGNMSLKSF